VKAAVSDELKKLNSKANYKLAVFSDKVLRTLEEEEIQAHVLASLQGAGLDSAQLARMADHPRLRGAQRRLPKSSRLHPKAP